MVGVSLPRRLVSLVGLIPPSSPALARATRKQFKKRPRAARFENIVLLIRLPRMLALSCCKQVYLPPSGRKCARVLAAHTEQDQLCDVAEIETNSASIRAAVLAHLMPDDVGLVGEAPRLHDSKAFGQHCVGAPEIQMRSGRR